MRDQEGAEVQYIHIRFSRYVLLYWAAVLEGPVVGLLLLLWASELP